MNNPEFEKSKIFAIDGMSDYASHGVVVKPILKKATGNVNAIFVDTGEALTEELSRFDRLIQIIEGKAEVFIDDISYSLNSGQFLIIPSHSRNIIRAKERFTMISTIIKSGYE